LVEIRVSPEARSPDASPSRPENSLATQSLQALERRLPA